MSHSRLRETADSSRVARFGMTPLEEILRLGHLRLAEFNLLLTKLREKPPILRVDGVISNQQWYFPAAKDNWHGGN